MVTQIALHDYMARIDDLLAEERYHEAANHSRHILSQLPRHVDSYKALAKALLGQEKHAEAIELFQRVLSADPNELIAHIGLADLYKADKQMESALWHLERAFEIAPYNSPLRDELRRMRANQDRANGDQMRLTPTALAHLYVRGEMYPEAIAELRHLLDEEDERIDLQVLLAEALWRDERRIAAVNICQEILEKLPNCITANAILSDVYLRTDRAEDARSHLWLLQSLTQLDRQQCDPATLIGHVLSSAGDTWLPSEVMVDLLDDGAVQPASFVDMPASEAPPDAPVEVVPSESETEDMYGWLNEIGASPEAQPAQDLTAEADELADVETDTETEAEAEAESEPASASGWLSSLWDEAPETAEAESATHPEVDFDQLEDETPAMDAIEESDAALPVDVDAASAQMPDWLAADMEQVDDEVPASDDEADIPDWLLEATSSDFDAVQMDPLTASQWLSADEEEEPDSTVTAEIAAAGGTTAWLSSLSEDLEDLDSDVAELEDVDEWLASLADESESAKPEVEVKDEQPPEETADTGLPSDWLTSAADDESEEFPSDDWLGALAGDAEYLDSEPAISPAPAETADDELPADWLSDAADDESEELPIDDWLSDAADDESEEILADDWLSTAADDESEELPADDWLSTAADDESEAFPADDWLSDAADDESEEFSSDDWLGVLAGGPDLLSDEPEPEDMKPAPEMEDSQLPADWLADMEEGEAEEEADDWLSLLMAEEEATPEHVGADVQWPDLEPTGDEPYDDDQRDRVEAVVMDEQDDKDKKRQEEQPESESSQDDSDSLDEMKWLSEIEETAEDMVSPADTSQVEDWLGLGDDEALPDWLLDSEAPVEKAVSPSTSQEEPPKRDIPEWLLTDEWEDVSDDVEDFLEEETAPQESETPGPTTAFLAQLDTGSQQDEMDWLTQLAEQSGDELEDDVKLPWLDWMEEEDETKDTTLLDAETLHTAGVEETPYTADEIEADAPLEVPEDLDDAMSWLEDLAAEQGAPVDPLPTVADVLDEEMPTDLQPETDMAFTWDEPAAEEADDESLDETMAELDETMSWLDELSLAEDEALEFDSLEPDSAETAPAIPTEQQTPTDVDEFDIEPAGDDLEEELLPAPPTELSDADLVSDVPEDLEEAMAWLENLAAQQGASIEELPSLSTLDESVAKEEAEPEELDWLDQLELEAAPDADEDTFDDWPAQPEPAPVLEDAEDDLTPLLDWLEELALADSEEMAIAPVEGGLTVATEDELVAALDWLEQAAELETGHTEPDLAAPVEDEAPAMIDAPDFLETADEAKDLFDDDYLDIPDDPNEALAWLEQVAEETYGQPAAEEKLEEMETVITTPETDQPETAVTGEETAVTEEDEPPSPEFDLDDIDAEFLAPEDPDEAMAWLEQLAARQDATLDEPLSTQKESEELQTPDSTEAGVEIEAAETFDVDWLHSLPEPDVTGWLEAEEAATISSPRETGPLSDTGLSFDATPSDTKPLDASKLPEGEMELPLEEPSTASVLEIDQDRLSYAQQSLAQGDYSTAIETYQTLVATGEGLGLLINDLETATASYPRQPTLQRVLGDAYMRNGQLQKALHAYRQALDQL